MIWQDAIVLGLALVFCGCSTSRPNAAQSPTMPAVAAPLEDTTGPTVISRVHGGYELRNHLYRVVISDQPGDVTFWGSIDQTRNTVFQRGIYTSLTGLPDAPIRGYVEMRDEQTWQFHGEDDNHITWRKIYSLQNDSLLVSVIIQNNRSEPLVTAIQICGDLPNLRIVHHDPEQFTGQGGYGLVSLHGFNEFHAPTSQPALPVLIQSDTFHLKPQERQGFTTQWKLSPS